MINGVTTGHRMKKTKKPLLQLLSVIVLSICSTASSAAQNATKKGGSPL